MKLDDFAFLTDQNINPEVVAFLPGRGLDVASAEELGLANAADTLAAYGARDKSNRIDPMLAILALAIAAGQTILGIVFLRPGHIQAGFTIRTLDAIFEVNPELTPPFLVVAIRSRDKVRIRTRSL